MYSAPARTALAIALLAAAAMPAQAAYTWNGHTLSEMYGAKTKISTKCGKETKRQADVDNFLTLVDGARSRLAEFLKSLAEDTKAVQDAKATKDMQKEADAMVSEMKKIRGGGRGSRLRTHFPTPSTPKYIGISSGPIL